MGEKSFDIEVSGEGDSAQLFLNSVMIPGTLQLPADAEMAESNRLEFKRCSMSETPLLFLQAEDMPVRDFKYENNCISFTVTADRHTVLRFHAGSEPAWSGTSEISAEWKPNEKQLLLEGTFRKGERIEVRI